MKGGTKGPNPDQNRILPDIRRITYIASTETLLTSDALDHQRRPILPEATKC
jgi:hypothetical protein